MARGETREKSWRANLAEQALIFALVVVAGVAALLVHIYASQWAALAVWSGIAILTLASVAYFRLRRFKYRWLFIGMFTTALGFSILLAVMQGWETQTYIGVIGGTVIFTIAIVGALTRSTARFNRRITEGARKIGEQLQGEGLFRDDGERITVHVDRSKLLRRTLTQIVALSLFAGAFIWARSSDLVAPVKLWLSIGLGFVLCVGGLVALLNLTRLLMNGPTLVVNADGITDNGSLIVTGRGLLRWNEVLEIEEITIDLSDIPWRQRSLFKALNGSLDINLADFRAVRQRQPLWKRALVIFVGGGRQPLGPRILPALLDRPAVDLVSEINRYIQTHAPEGSWHKAMTDEEIEQQDES
jgi:hypothetical protein